MNITNWNPLREIEEIFDRYNRRIGVPLLESGRGHEMLTTADWCPAVDIEETGKEFLLKVELPEVNKDDVKVTINKDILNIEGERRIEKESKEEKKYHRIERYYGRFSRSFTLPEYVKKDEIKAEFRDGLLRIHLEKTEKAKPKSIEVEIAA